MCAFNIFFYVSLLLLQFLFTFWSSFEVSVLKPKNCIVYLLKFRKLVVHSSEWLDRIWWWWNKRFSYRSMFWFFCVVILVSQKRSADCVLPFALGQPYINSLKFINRFYNSVNRTNTRKLWMGHTHSQLLLSNCHCDSSTHWER